MTLVSPGIFCRQLKLAMGNHLCTVEKTNKQTNKTNKLTLVMLVNQVCRQRYTDISLSDIVDSSKLTLLSQLSSTNNTTLAFVSHLFSVDSTKHILLNQLSTIIDGIY